MASSFKNAALALTTSYQTVYTCPASTKAIVLTCQITNVDGTNSASASVQWLDDSNGDAATRVLEAGLVPAGYAIDALVKKIVLEAGDALQAKASATGDLELTAAILEIS